MTSTEILRQIDSTRAQLTQVERDLDGTLNDPQRFISLETRRQASEALLTRLQTALADARTREAAAQLEVDKEAARAEIEATEVEAAELSRQIVEATADVGRYLEARLVEVIEPLRAQLAEVSSRHAKAHPVAYGQPVRFGEGLMDDFNNLNPAQKLPQLVNPPKGLEHANLALTVLLHDLRAGPLGIREVMQRINAPPPQPAPTPQAPEPVADVEDDIDPDDFGAFIARTHNFQR